MTSVLANLDNVASSDEEEVVMKRRGRRGKKRVQLVMEESSDNESDEEEDDQENVNVVMSSDYESSDEEGRKKSLTLDEAMGRKSGFSVVMSSDDDEDSEEEEGRKKSLTLDEAMGMKQQNNNNDSFAQRKKVAKLQQNRRRRRSSARFLRLSGRFDIDDEQEEEEQDTHQANEQLGEMYKRAIRMNAENRINAGNSWGLRLIENIDKFLVEDDTTTTPDMVTDEQQDQPEKRVNFTKASCTIDASVKIYSYRVDDVHLTSYKVLANLNRTNNSKDNDSRAQRAIGNNENDGGDGDAEEGPTRRRKTQCRSNTQTLETNLGNINLNKLDSAYDIDPLFHKMSKTFDEGGAKGLLLVNLGVGMDGCGIVFDSKEDTTEEVAVEENKEEEEEDTTLRADGMVDISSLIARKESLLDGATVDSLSLVPQLACLREDFASLDAEGYVDKDEKTKSKRYAAPQEEEKEAEMSIHQEALERSRASVGAKSTTSYFSQGGFFSPTFSQGTEYAPDDFGAGDHDDGDDEEFEFNDFIATDDNVARYSTLSFNDNDFEENEDEPASTTALLDALISGEATQGGDYEYFDKKTIEKVTGGNMWAGSAHWKKRESRTGKKTPKKNKTPRKKKTKKAEISSESCLIDLSKPPANLDEILKKPTRKKTRGRASNTDPLQWPKATKTKHSNSDNLLPPDAGVGIEELSKLFLRPNATIAVEEPKTKKTVGFSGLDDVGSNNGFDYGGDDDSYGGEDDGPGFDFADPSDGTYGAQEEEDVVVKELDDVRKVEKIKVGYATVAKKVDVKRLKKDLWTEIESSLVVPDKIEEPAGDTTESESTAEEHKEKEMDNDMDEEEERPAKCLSFQETVKELEASQSQSDVTIPFYFICLLHLANEKCLRLDSKSLQDFEIYDDSGPVPLEFDNVVQEPARVRTSRKAAPKVYKQESSSDEEEGE